MKKKWKQRIKRKKTETLKELVEEAYLNLYPLYIVTYPDTSSTSNTSTWTW